MDWRITATAMVLGTAVIVAMLGFEASDLMRRIGFLEEQVGVMRGMLGLR